MGASPGTWWRDMCGGPSERRYRVRFSDGITRTLDVPTIRHLLLDGKLNRWNEAKLANPAKTKTPPVWAPICSSIAPREFEISVLYHPVLAHAGLYLTLGTIWAAVAYVILGTFVYLQNVMMDAQSSAAQGDFPATWLECLILHVILIVCVGICLMITLCDYPGKLPLLFFTGLIPMWVTLGVVLLVAGVLALAFVTGGVSGFVVGMVVGWRRRKHLPRPPRVPLPVLPDEPSTPPTPLENDAAASPSAQFVAPPMPVAPTAPDRARNAESRTKTSEEIREDVLSWLEEQRDSSHSLPTETKPQDAAGDSARTCPGCNAPLAHDALICIQCGYHTRTGVTLRTERIVRRDKPVVSMFAAFFGREVHAVAIQLTIFALFVLGIWIAGDMFLREFGTAMSLGSPEFGFWMILIAVVLLVSWIVFVAFYAQHFMYLCALGAGANTGRQGFTAEFLAGFMNSLVPLLCLLPAILFLPEFGPVGVVLLALAVGYYYYMGMTVAALEGSLAPNTVFFWMFVCLPRAVLLFPVVTAVYSGLLFVVLLALATAFPFLSLPDHPLVLAALFGIPYLHVCHLAPASLMLLLGRLARLKQAELGWGGEVGRVSLAGCLRSGVVLSAIVGTGIVGAYLFPEFPESNPDKITARESLPTPEVWLREVLGQLGLPTGPETESPPNVDAAVPEDPSGQIEASGDQEKPVGKTQPAFLEPPNEAIPPADQREEISLEDATMHQSPSSSATVANAETSADAHHQPAPRWTDREDVPSADVAGIFLRTWTDRTGKFQVRAEFQSYEEPMVTLKKEDGSVVAVPLARLSSEDQDFVLAYVQRRKHLESKRTPQP